VKGQARGNEVTEEDHMIVLGLILLILGWVLGIGILVTIGIIVLVIGVVFLILGQTGRAVGGRKYWY
jgi:Flp pilus assembly protein TadB